ncbi:MAG TPA: alpha/beta fold hydrolase [Candidatus Limnocylindrales bacterium]|nr:alpha/beta fold hydrolase [Candidatus Limnocylindrales bacterium]
MVFVHGAILSRAMWRPQVERLRDRYRCISVDLPGHGALAGQPFRLDAAVAAVASAIDLDADGHALVVGLSLGGYTAIALAARHPERVRGVVVAGASLEPTGIARLGFAAYGWLLTLAPERLGRWIVARVLLRKSDRADAARIAAGLEIRRGGVAVRSLGGTSFRTLLRRYVGPVLFINGERDVVMRSGERGFVRGVSGVRRLRLRRAGHISNLDRPDDFADAVAAFEATLPA